MQCSFKFYSFNFAEAFTELDAQLVISLGGKLEPEALGELRGKLLACKYKAWNHATHFFRLFTVSLRKLAVSGEELSIAQYLLILIAADYGLASTSPRKGGSQM
ncbi:hypothetical protein NUACC21_09230 [Scytonema sp. NUACC21]